MRRQTMAVDFPRPPQARLRRLWGTSTKRTQALCSTTIRAGMAWEHLHPQDMMDHLRSATDRWRLWESANYREQYARFLLSSEGALIARPATAPLKLQHPCVAVQRRDGLILIHPPWEHRVKDSSPDIQTALIVRLGILNQSWHLLP